MKIPPPRKDIFLKVVEHNRVPELGILRLRAQARKSASLFLLRRNANLGFQKRNCALKF
jgi:hypothetical protein